MEENPSKNLGYLHAEEHGHRQSSASCLNRSVVLQSLKTLVYPFESMGRLALEAILCTTTRCTEGFCVSSSFIQDLSTSFVVRSRNRDYSAVCSLSLDAADLPKLFSKRDDLNMWWDVLGEITNTVSGRFLGNPRFVALFPGITSSPPVFWSGSLKVVDTCAIQGSFEINSVKLLLGFMLNPRERPLTFL